jgi:NarL family two-component system sensor histidine kinase LiaS
VGTFRIPNLTGPLLITVGVSAILLTIPAAFLGAIFGFLTAWGLTRRLQRLARAAQAWSRGDFSVAVKDRSKDELGQLSRELNNMAAQLENLIQARQELATLEARNRFARDLHDSVKQQVFATSLQIAAARALIERDTEASEAHLTQADELVRQAQKELNVLIHEMRPAELEGKGLAAALRDYVRDWTQRAEIPAEFHVRGEREVSLEAQQALFRVAQEALANVAKHSGAENMEVDLIYNADALTLRIADDGRGFDPAAPGGGFGLQSMHERLARLGGRVNVESAPGKGTRIECVCPLESPSSKKGRRP